MTDTMKDPFVALDRSKTWEPYAYSTGNGFSVHGFRRSDGMGYVLPCYDNNGPTENWWVTWAHDMLLGRPGWHHLAFGTYPGAEAGAIAFDKVYELEFCSGNVDRTSREDAATVKRGEHSKPAFEAARWKAMAEELAGALNRFAAIEAEDGDDFSTYAPQVIIRCEITANDLHIARQSLTRFHEMQEDEGG